MIRQLTSQQKAQVMDELVANMGLVLELKLQDINVWYKFDNICLQIHVERNGFSNTFCIPWVLLLEFRDNAVRNAITHSLGKLKQNEILAS